MSDLMWVYAADIVKAARNDEGDLEVFGKAAGPQLDIDRQVCDPDWLKAAMPQWMNWGNMREQHTMLAAGVGKELTQDGDDWWLKSVCVDPGTAAKIEKKVLTGYSIGIKAPRFVKDAAAPGGRIVGGDIVEISYVDRSSNPTCSFTIAKAAGADWEPVDAAKAADTTDDDEDDEVEPGDGAVGNQPGSVPNVPGSVADKPKSPGPDATKRAVASKERKKLADKGHAMPGGGFPISNVADLKNAIRAIGRAKDPAATRAFIKKRAAALGRTDLIPDTWKAVLADLVKADDDTWTHDTATLAQVRDGLAQLMQAELDELMAGENEIWDVSDLLTCLSTFLCWWKHEAFEGEAPLPEENDMDFVALGANPDLLKAARADGATDDDRSAARAEIVKALGLDKPAEPPAAAGAADTGKDADADLTKAAEQRITDLEAQLAEVKKLAAPGGPARTGDAVKSAEADVRARQARYYRDMASQVSDFTLQQGYLAKAAQLDPTIAGSPAA